MKRIGIMGGTFNPVHLAHLILAEAAYEQFSLDQVVFLPSRQPAYKDNKEILPDFIRYHMLELAIEGNPHFSISDLELKREGNTYTADTILEWKRLEPDTELYFIIGGDSLMTFDQWSRPEVVLANAHLLATGRGELEKARLLQRAEELNRKYHSNISFFETPAMELSSTKLREKIREGKSVRYLIPGPVEELILEKGYYRDASGKGL